MTTEERAAIQAKIDGLPSGGISNKTINGKTYAYYQWTENGRQHSKRVQDDELPTLSEAIAERKRLIALLREESAIVPETEPPQYQVSCRLGTALRRYADPVKTYKKRDCYPVLEQFVYGEPVRADEIIPWFVAKIPEVDFTHNDSVQRELPLAFSAGLRTLHALELITLETQPDTEVVRLYFVDGDEHNMFSHITVRKEVCI